MAASATTASAPHAKQTAKPLLGDRSIEPTRQSKPPSPTSRARRSHTHRHHPRHPRLHLHRLALARARAPRAAARLDPRVVANRIRTSPPVVAALASVSRLAASSSRPIPRSFVPHRRERPRRRRPSSSSSSSCVVGRSPFHRLPRRTVDAGDGARIDVSDRRHRRRRARVCAPSTIARARCRRRDRDRRHTDPYIALKRF